MWPCDSSVNHVLRFEILVTPEAVHCRLSGRKRMRRRELSRGLLGMQGSLLNSAKPLIFFITMRVLPYLHNILYSINSWRYCQKPMCLLCILNNLETLLSVVICLEYIFVCSNNMLIVHLGCRIAVPQTVILCLVCLTCSCCKCPWQWRPIAEDATLAYFCVLGM